VTKATSPCGTQSAYARHRRHGEPIDEACRIAHREYNRASLQRRREWEAAGCPTRICRNEKCNREFQPSANNVIYCSRRCSDNVGGRRAHRRSREAALAGVSCCAPFCDNPIMAGTRRSKFCSDACRSFVQRLRRYNISYGQYEQMRTAQNHHCALWPACTNGLADGSGFGFIDHDHDCCAATPGAAAWSCGKCIRGILCRQCNTLLGQARDNPAILQAAIAYLAGGT
jgi:hypothetical protein